MTHEPRLDAIARHVLLARRAIGLTMSEYAARVVDVYHQRTALADRTVSFEVGTTSDALEKATRANTQTVQRFLDGTVRAPIDIEEALVLALPDAQRTDCLRALAARYGLLAAPQPATDGPAQQIQVAELLRDTGRMMVDLAPAFDDNILDSADAPIARRVLPAALDLIARLTSLARMLEHISHARTPLRAVP